MIAWTGIKLFCMVIIRYFFISLISHETLALVEKIQFFTRISSEYFILSCYLDSRFFHVTNRFYQVLKLKKLKERKIIVKSVMHYRLHPPLLLSHPLIYWNNVTRRFFLCYLLQSQFRKPHIIIKWNYLYKSQSVRHKYLFLFF